MNIKAARIMLVVILIITLLVGCGEKPSSEQEDAPKSVSAVKLIEHNIIPATTGFLNPTVNVVCEKTDDGIQFYDEKGNKSFKADYDNAESALGNDMYIVSNGVLDERVYGVVDADAGIELIPCEMERFRRLSDRFLTVAHDEWYYRLIFDLQTKDYVPDLKIKDESLTVYASETLIFVKDENTTTAYESTGQEVAEFENLRHQPDWELLLYHQDDITTVYDMNLNVLSELPEHHAVYSHLTHDEEYTGITGTRDKLRLWQYISEKSANGFWFGESEYHVTDLSGNIISAKAYEHGFSDIYADQYIYYYANDRFEDTVMRGIDDLQGNTIIPAQYTRISYYEPGYFICGGNGTIDVYTEKGELISSDLKKVEELLCTNEAGEVLILKTGEMRAFDEEPTYLCASLIQTGSDVIDVISGEVVLTTNGRRACYIDDSLYLYQSGIGYIRYTAEYVE